MGVRWDAFKVWLNTVPNCPSCKGTGQPGLSGDVAVYWRGILVWVCFQCKGSGKC